MLMDHILLYIICVWLSIHLEPDTLECEVKWALGSITTNKASGGDGIPAELFQILKDVAVIVMHSLCQQIWKTQQWPQNWKRSVFFPIPKKSSANEYSNYRTIAFISHARKIISKARRQKYLNRELPDVQTDFRKGRRTRDQIANICCIVVKAREFPKTSTSASLTMLKPLTVEHNKLENSSKDWNTRPLYLPPEKSVCRLRSSS